MSGSIKARIDDCVDGAKNGARATWSGATNGTSSEAIWKLVTRNGALKEVWQDQRTGLIWSSLVSTSTNWCNANGSTQLAPVTLSQVYGNATPGTAMTGNGTITNIAGGSSSASETIIIAFTGATTYTVTGATCTLGSQNQALAGAGTTSTWSRANYCSFTLTQGSTPFASGDTIIVKSTAAASYSCAPGGPLQSNPATSYCAEDGSLQPAVAGEDWNPVGGVTYDAAKGGMGLNSTDVVRWRLPTIRDYMQAEIDGIRFVMPDMGIAGTARIVPDVTGNVSTTGTSEWSATVISNLRTNSSYFHAPYGSTGGNNRFLPYGARCVGR